MKLVRQPPDSACSGQAVLAMLLKTTLEDATYLMGTDGEVSTKALIEALRRLGVVVGDRRVPTRGKKLPPTCIAFVRGHHGASGRWILRWKGRKYDPAADWAVGDVVMTSYIALG